MKHFVIVLSMMLSLGLSSCSSDDSPTAAILNSPVENSNFYGLSEGNYWVYEHFMRHDITNEMQFRGIVDSVSVVGQEAVFGDMYYKLKSVKTNTTNNTVTETFSYVREFNGFLVNKANEVLFVNNNYSEQLVERLNSEQAFYGVLQTNPKNIIVDGESLSCQEFVVTLKINEEPIGYIQRYYYAEGIGLVHHELDYFDTNTQLTPFYIEKRLVAYNVK